jgi:CDP-glycerol glycerophosphotransferase (TagB/SpsB family)
MAFARLNFLSADFVLATTPGLNVFQWKRSKDVKHYSHIRHSADEPIKYEMFGMDYFDSILVSGLEFQESDIRKLEKARNLPEKQVVTTGCPYLDEFAKEMENIPEEENHLFTVLVSPSWGKSALLSRFGEKLLDPLAKTGWRIIVRPHPQSLVVEKEMINRLSAKYEGNANIEWDFERDNIYSLKKADVMISDFSGIILDYMFLRNKPVFYVAEKLDWRTRDAFEIYEDQNEMWTFRNLKRTGIEIKPEMLDELPELITKAISDTTLESAIAEVKAQAWHYQRESGKQTADFMIKTAEALTL